METLPNEFLAQHHPLVFVAGILPGPSPASSTPEAVDAKPAASKDEDDFDVLTGGLRAALAPKRTFAIWDNARRPSPEFHVVLVEKNIPFPPRKARPPQAGPPHPLHSPLSPLSPSSPLFPDGILAPIWVRKHRDLQPSIFILVERLYEPPSLSLPLGNGPSERPPAEAEAERRHDLALGQAIVERKRTTSERGIKLAVIILTSRRMLDDPSLDVRLSGLRRASGLDSRSSLFVLSPLPPSEVQRFVTSLKSELYESALDYYREHSRRVRRKRGRPSATASSTAYAMQQSGAPGQAPLGQQGWHVRADFKLATFAEFRGEQDVALKHYEDCWDGLCTMFASTAILPPRTKRWAEAKVLVDCVNVKICKLLLYTNESSRALARFNLHVARFHDFCNGWGIGDETFEFWSWLSKQYRLFADLVDLACRNGFRLTVTLPPSPASLPVGAGPGAAAAGTFGLATKTVLQHAGFYYFESAACAEERRNRFHEAQREEEEMRAKLGDSFTGSLALVHEKKVNHAEVIVELYTKSYELFKKFNSNRMTLFIASRIADAHRDGKDHGMALRFYERIAKSYRREGSAAGLDAVLLEAYRSAKADKSIPHAVALGYELLTRSDADDIEKLAVMTELPKLLELAPPLNETEARIEVDLSQSPPLLQATLAFWSPSAHVGHPVPFQIVLGLPPNIPPEGSLALDQVEICFTSGRKVVLASNPPSTEPQHVQVVEIGTFDQQDCAPLAAHLTWAGSSTVVVRGAYVAQTEEIVALEGLALRASANGWSVDVTSAVAPAESVVQLSWLKEAGDDKALLPLESLARECKFGTRAANLAVEWQHQPSALLDEFFPIRVGVRHEDAFPVDVYLSAALVNSKGDIVATPDDAFILEGNPLPVETIETHPLGSLDPSTALDKIIFLRFTGSEGDRRLHLTLLSSPRQPVVGVAPSTELDHDIKIPVSRPFSVAFETAFVRRAVPLKEDMGFETPSGWEDAKVSTVAASIDPVGSPGVWLDRLQVDCSSSSSVRTLVTSLPEHGVCETELRAGNAFAFACQLEVAAASTGAVPSLILHWCRLPRDDSVPLSRTAIPFDALIPPVEPVLVLARIPNHSYLHEQATLSYTVTNTHSTIMDLAFQLESSDQWLFSGPRKIGRALVLPGADRTVNVHAIPVNLGRLEVPRLRVFERVRLSGPLVDDRAEVDQGQQDGQEAIEEPEIREVEVVREGETSSPLTIMVLPR